MNIKDVFPALGEKSTKLLNKNSSWTKRGPGRRHNPLTAKHQAANTMLMTKVGMSATQALNAIGHI